MYIYLQLPFKCVVIFLVLCGNKRSHSWINHLILRLHNLTFQTIKMMAELQKKIRSKNPTAFILKLSKLNNTKMDYVLSYDVLNVNIKSNIHHTYIHTYIHNTYIRKLKFRNSRELQ